MIRLDIKLELDESLITPLILEHDSLENYIILDIETTGFSSENNMIYLIGYIYYKEDSFYMTQFLCEKKEDEYEMLFLFSQILGGYKYVIHYNGKSFDIPFIKNRFRKFNIKSTISELIEVDFYLRLKPFQSYIPTENLKLKTIERYCGFNRTDNYDGGKLIKIFNDFLLSPVHELKNMLLLHNKEDLLGLFQSFKLFDLLYFFEQAVSGNIQVNNTTSIINDSFLHIIVPYQFDNCIECHLDLGIYQIALESDKIIIKIAITKGTLNHYYEDYKNYYYLREEQQAIHKSIAKYVDNEYKEKATRENCYIKKRGIFIPLIKNMNYNSHTFKQHFSSKEIYVELNEQLLDNKELLIRLTKCILSSI